MRPRCSMHRGLAMVVTAALLLPAVPFHLRTSASLVGPPAFTKHTIITGAFTPRLFHACNLDGDNDVDLLVGNGGASYFTWLENTGSQAFLAHRIAAPSVMSLSTLLTADLDEDGDVDILAAAYNADWAGWWENDGNQNFTAHPLRSLGGAFGIDAADLDGDRDMDVIVAGSKADRVEWGENDGQQGFTWHTLASGIDNVRAAVAADLDKDGDQDVLVAGRGGGVHWCENDGLGGFVRRTVAAAWDAGSVSAADMDEDGDQDILGASVSGNRIAWWENGGHENFTLRTVAETPAPYAAYPADMDGDGDLDVVSAGGQYPVWWENDGHQAFAERSVTAGAVCEAAIPADVDGDGDVDILGGDYYGGEVAWWESNAASAWPDFALESLTVSPSPLETMENAAIFLDIRNVGWPSQKSGVRAEVTLRDADTGTEYLLIFPGTLEALDTNESSPLDIHPFVFYDSAIDQVRVCIRSDEAESNPQNNCKAVDVVLSEPAQPWQGCIGSLIAIADALLDATPAKQVNEGAKLITHIFALQIPGIIAACTAGDEPCADSVTAFLVDSAIGLARLAGDATALKVLSVGHSAMQAFKDSLACGDYLGMSLRAWNENARHRNVKVNAVAARSPAYVRVVDSSGRRAGFLDDGSIVSEIPDADAFQLDGEKYILYPGDDTASVELKGTAIGTVGLIVSLARPDDRTITAEYRAVPVTATTRGSLSASTEDYTLRLDDNGDGTADRSVGPDEIAEERIYRVRLPSVLACR